MKPIGPLMWEHRLIEKMVALMKEEESRETATNEADIGLIETAVDFMRTYADRTHHGKEEDILFKALESRSMSDKHRRIMDELIEEHVRGRKLVKELESAKNAYRNGGSGNLPGITACLGKLAEFYPRHILKEDKHFFFPVMAYFTAEEQAAMLAEFYQFDSKMLHDKYEALVKAAAATAGSPVR